MPNRRFIDEDLIQRTQRRPLLWGSCLLFALAALLSGCGANTPEQNKLVTEYDVTAPAGAVAKVQFGTDTNYGLETWTQPAPAGGGTIKIAVAGMRANTLYHMRAVTTLADGTVQTDHDRTFRTGSIAGRKVENFTATGNESAGRGVELVNFVTQTPGATDLQALVTDLSGHIIWYYDHDPSEGSVFPIKLLPNGHMLLTISDNQSTSFLREVDLQGNIVSQVTKEQLQQALQDFGYNHAIKILHHDFQRLSNGHTILIASEDRQLSGLTGYMANTPVEGDDVIDLDENMKVAWVWSTFDHLDPNRHPLSGMPDWTHANGLVYTADHNLLLSMRNQSWIVKIDYQDGTGTGDILWRLGYQGDFTLTNGGVSDWFYGQHYPHVLSSDGTTTRLAVFDDGNNRVKSNGAVCHLHCYSRAVILDLDEQAKTAKIEFSYLPDLFTPWGGDVRELSSGDIELDASAPLGLPGSRVEEITDGANPQVVWQMDMSIPAAYRAYRIPSLYPGVQW